MMKGIKEALFFNTEARESTCGLLQIDDTNLPRASNGQWPVANAVFWKIGRLEDGKIGRLEDPSRTELTKIADFIRQKTIRGP